MIRNLIGSILILSSIYSCETIDMDVNINPNELTMESADPNYVLNQIQTTFINQHVELSDLTSRLIRQRYQFGTYASNAGVSSMNNPWTNTYAITSNLNLLKKLSETKNLPNHVGIGQILEAFAYVNLVDMIGKAVYTQAVNPNYPSPELDSGDLIYNEMFAQLDEAINNLTVNGSIKPEDIFYNGDLSKWIKLANTLKIKMYLSTRLVNPKPEEINKILLDGSYISTNSDDFQLKYGTSETNPDTRHPFFKSDYLTTAGSYQSNQFMYKLAFEKGIKDPRLPYYFYRQTIKNPLVLGEELGIGGDLLPCDGASNYSFCYIGDGYWGRDHGDDEGIPNDGIYRTAFGVYPGGGAYDDGTTNGPTIKTNNKGGAGLHPILASTYVNFMLAELSLPQPSGIGINGNAKEYLEKGVRQSLDKVASFSGIPMDSQDKENYVLKVLELYDMESSPSGRLSVIINEYYIALFGNGIEAYNNYRRTGFPELQKSVISGTEFPRSFFLPSSELNSNDNPNLKQKSLTDQVFWDINPAGFIE